MFSLLLRNFRLAYEASRFYVIALVAANIVYAAIDLSALLILARLIDLFIAYTSSRSPAIVNEAWWWFGALVVRWIAANLCNQFLDYLNDIHKPRVLDYTDNMIITKLDRLPTETIESSDFQNYMTNIHTFGKVKFVENLNLVGLLVQYLSLFMYALGALLLSSPYVALIIIVVSIPEVRYNLKIIRKMRELNKELALERRRGSYYISVTQDIAQYFNLKSYNLFPFFLNRIKKAQETIISGNRGIQRYHKPRAIAIGTVANLLGQFLPKGYYVWSTLNGRISVGQFQLYYRLIDEAYNNSYRLYMSYLQISENNIYVKDLFALFDMSEHQPVEEATIDLSSIELEFRNVSFTYPESDRQVLTDVSFTVKQGEKLAIVGHNGAGKTTITRLTNKFYQPTKGVILVNGVDLGTIDDTVWRSTISNLSQDVPRFYLSAKDNVIIGDQTRRFDEKRYRQSIKEARIAKDIERLPKKDENVLGKYFPGGVNLSGGQWQKLSIARSFYRQASLLILDEPTSAVDSKTEQEIFDAIFERSNSQAQIIISHKFSNIKKADHIVVMADGRVLEEGGHAKLIRDKGEYATLYEQQSAAFSE
ncbi:MAG TPA: ABC transporter ATP-binding protein [Verrucomicrobiae bacterium]|nr:ABC transporter ATP-binding protein [Verrucomicrobiae bacterium]